MNSGSKRGAWSQTAWVPLGCNLSEPDFALLQKEDNTCP